MSQGLYKLPDGWAWSTLAEQTVPTKNINPTSEPKRRFTYIDISSIDRNINQIIDPKIILGSESPSRARKEVFANDVLFATTRPNLKNVAMFSGDIESPVASTGFCVLRAAEKIEPRFLFRFLTTEFLQKQILPFVSGAQYPAITDKNLKATPIPIPPLNEQKRIVAKLDALFTRIDTAITHLQQTLELSKALFASALDEVFLPENNNGKSVPLNQVATVARGKSKHRPRNDKTLFGGDYPFIQTGNVRNAGKHIIAYSSTYNEKGLAQSKLWPKGTVCLTIAANIGEVAILGMDACFPDSVVGISSDSESNEYIYYFLTTLQRHLDSKATMAAQKNINLRVLSDIEIPLPSLDEQKRIVAHLDVLSERTRKLEASTQEKINDLTALKASLLDAAFKGEL